MEQIVEKSRTWLAIDLDTLQENFCKIRKSVAPAKVLAVLKADAYGLGVHRIAERLSQAGADGFCVADLHEALPLLPFGKPVQILGSVLDFEIPEIVANGIIVGITDLETAKKISHEAVLQNRIQECHFKLDTGMGRLGILSGQAVDLIMKIKKLPHLNCCGIYSHFPTVYKDENSKNVEQIKIFHSILNECEKRGIRFEKIHFANSDAINCFAPAVTQPFNYVRTGINLYGSFNSAGRKNLDLQSVLTLKSRIVSVRKLPAGSTIGYDCTCKLSKDTLVGIICAGYADGLPLNLSNRGHVLIHGRLCPILGRISMDYTSISLEQFQENDVQPGDEVTLLGTGDIHDISVEKWAELKGTHPYDILCSFGQRVHKIYLSR